MSGSRRVSRGRFSILMTTRERVASSQDIEPAERERPGIRRVWLFNGVLWAIAVGLLAGPVAQLDAVPEFSWLVLAALVPAFAVAEVVIARVTVRHQAGALTMSEVPLIVGLAFAPPGLVLLARLIGAGYVLAVRTRTAPFRLHFNLAQSGVETCVSALVWYAVLNGAAPTSPRGWAAALATVAAGNVVASATLTLAVSLHSGRVEGSMMRTLGRPGFVTGFANASFGVVIITVLSLDWRAAWTLVAVGLMLLQAHRSYAALEHKHLSLERLYDFTRATSGPLEADEVLLATLDRTRELLRASKAEVVLWDESGITRLRKDDEHVERAEDMGVLMALVGGGVLDEPLVVDAGDPHRASALAAAGVSHLAAVPLGSAGHRIGTVMVADRVNERDSFDADDVKLLETIAGLASSVLERTRLVSELRTQADESQHRALHDSLTGLPNRSLFNERVRGALQDGHTAAVLLMDLDRFKEVNDTLGHHVGDQLLQQVAARLSGVLPEHATIARFGGDEFAILLPQVHDPAVARLAGKTVCDVLAEPFPLGDMSVGVTGSVGIALGPTHGEDPELLLRRADVAMYNAKSARTGAEVYTQDSDMNSPRRLELLSDLRQAIEAGTLTLHYQPKLDLVSGHVEGVEALARWEHPTHGFIGPDEFIPMAEHTGQIVPLTELVLSTALAQCRTWSDEGFQLPVAVNVSATSLLDVTFPERVARLLSKADVGADLLTLEITESSMLADPERTLSILNALSGMGIRLSIDDFGTGFSSLSRLRQLPVDEVKIDRSFICAMASESEDGAIVRATLDLGHTLGLRVVAEGVEDHATCKRLTDMGCDAAQGYWFSRPQPAADLTEVLARWSVAGEGFVTAEHRAG